MPRKIKKILLVDDEGDLVQAVLFRLKGAGYQVDVATDGTEGLKKAAASPPDIILLDVLMPGLDGWEVCKRLRENPKTRDIPVVMMTGVPPAERKKTAERAGANYFLEKPFTVDQLFAIFRREEQG